MMSEETKLWFGDPFDLGVSVSCVSVGGWYLDVAYNKVETQVERRRPSFVMDGYCSRRNGAFRRQHHGSHAHGEARCSSLIDSKACEVA